MKKYIIISGILLFFANSNAIAQTDSSKSNSTFMIRHTVIFTLKYTKNSPEEKEFLTAAKILSSIPGVKKFESLYQISEKNDFDYGFSMEFESAEAYEGYNKHPDHVAFVETYWIRDVEDFLEIDYEPIK